MVQGKYRQRPEKTKRSDTDWVKRTGNEGRNLGIDRKKASKYDRSEKTYSENKSTLKKMCPAVVAW